MQRGRRTKTSSWENRGIPDRSETSISAHHSAGQLRVPSVAVPCTERKPARPRRSAPVTELRLRRC